tara:strand:- start:73 stop:408 length:336 start_codon:yes stop_codon:yes gene_type:complete
MSVYIEPGSLWQNGYAESFNRRFRDEFLTTELSPLWLRLRAWPIASSGSATSSDPFGLPEEYFSGSNLIRSRSMTMINPSHKHRAIQGFTPNLEFANLNWHDSNLSVYVFE